MSQDSVHAAASAALAFLSSPNHAWALKFVFDAGRDAKGDEAALADKTRFGPSPIQLTVHDLATGEARQSTTLLVPKVSFDGVTVGIAVEQQFGEDRRAGRSSDHPTFPIGRFVRENSTLQLVIITVARAERRRWLTHVTQQGIHTRSFSVIQYEDIGVLSADAIVASTITCFQAHGLERCDPCGICGRLLVNEQAIPRLSRAGVEGCRCWSAPVTSESALSMSSFDENTFRSTGMFKGICATTERVGPELSPMFFFDACLRWEIMSGEQGYSMGARMYAVAYFTVSQACGFPGNPVGNSRIRADEREERSHRPEGAAGTFGGDHLGRLQGYTLFRHPGGVEQTGMDPSYMAEAGFSNQTAQYVPTSSSPSEGVAAAHRDSRAAAAGAQDNDKITRQMERKRRNNLSAQRSNQRRKEERLALQKHLNEAKEKETELRERETWLKDEQMQLKGKIAEHYITANVVKTGNVSKR